MSASLPFQGWRGWSPTHLGPGQDWPPGLLLESMKQIHKWRLSSLKEAIKDKKNNILISNLCSSSLCPCTQSSGPFCMSSSQSLEEFDLGGIWGQETKKHLWQNKGLRSPNTRFPVLRRYLDLVTCYETVITYLITQVSLLLSTTVWSKSKTIRIFIFHLGREKAVVLNDPVKIHSNGHFGSQ